MHQIQLFLGALLLIFLSSVACKTDNPMAPDNPLQPDTTYTDTPPVTNRLSIRVGSRTFTATLLDNPAVTAFNARLPLTIEMSELNGNEKLYRFAEELPTLSSNPKAIQTGDLMIYSTHTLVLFYKSFPTVYSYTRLGKIDNPTGLAEALGNGNVTVTFTLSK